MKNKGIPCPRFLICLLRFIKLSLNDKKNILREYYVERIYPYIRTHTHTHIYNAKKNHINLTNINHKSICGVLAREAGCCTKGPCTIGMDVKLSFLGPKNCRVGLRSKTGRREVLGSIPGHVFRPNPSVYWLVVG